MMILVNIFKDYDESSKIFKKVDLTHHYRSIIDLLLGNISKVGYIWYNNRHETSDDQAAGLDEEVEELRLALTCFKPLCICLAHSSTLVQMDTSLDSVINDAAVVIYLLFVDRMDKETVVHATLSRAKNELVGFQEEIVAMKKDLLKGESDLQVISLVGMAGAGKTLLANHLFNECSHDGHFDKKAWCTVSQTYQIKDLLLTIFNQINQSSITDIDEQELANNLCRNLKRRRYLVVMDDVWDVSLWNCLSRYFPNDRNKSRILITTRDHNVASGIMSNIHKLEPLTEDESWELLQKKLGRQESLPDGIESIAKEVAKSCKGLPLSISIIGGLLHHADKNEEKWNQIAKDVTSTILSDPTGECKAILELSYNHLPDRLKPCFLYLGVFPEDHEISVARLVRLWVGERLVRGRLESDVCVEDVGRRYVDDLIKRSLIIPIKENTEGVVKTVRLHDLLCDFCLEKSKDEHFFTFTHDKCIFDLSLCPRRISINGDMYGNLPSSWNGVRTIISFDDDSKMDWILRSKHMFLLNVLDMPHLKANIYDSYLHHCVHLRYLAVWNLHSVGCFFREPSTLLNHHIIALNRNSRA